MTGIYKIHIPETTIGPGAIRRIGKIAAQFSFKRIMLVTDQGIVKAGIIDPVRSSLEEANLDFDLFDGCEPETPLSLVRLLSNRIKESESDLLIGIGGGSTLDAAKAAALAAANKDVPFSDILAGKRVVKTLAKILVPTTAGSGSEWSLLASVTDDAKDERTILLLNNLNIPDHVILDPELMMSLPPKITAETGMDALVHAVEAYTSRRYTIKIKEMSADFQMSQMLTNVGITEEDIPEMVEELFYMAPAIKAFNPRAVSKEDAFNIYKAALQEKIHENRYILPYHSKTI